MRRVDRERAKSRKQPDFIMGTFVNVEYFTLI